MEWWADNRTTTLCCRTATIEEMQARPAAYECRQCEREAREADLFAVNAQALNIYHRLCGRTIGDLGAAGWLLQVLTDGWSSDDVLDLVERIELIREVLDPPVTRPSGGTSQQTPPARH